MLSVLFLSMRRYRVIYSERRYRVIDSEADPRSRILESFKEFTEYALSHASSLFFFT